MSIHRYVSGLGYFELECNGHKLGDHELDIGWYMQKKIVLALPWPGPWAAGTRKIRRFGTGTVCGAVGFDVGRRTDYSKRVLYTSFDLAPCLAVGKNVIGVTERILFRNLGGCRRRTPRDCGPMYGTP